MDFKKIISSMNELEEKSNVSKKILVEAIKEALEKACRKSLGQDDALIRVDINEDNGTIKVFYQKKIVEDVEDDALEMELEEAHKFNANYQVGDMFEEEQDIEELGRAAASIAKNVMKQKIREASKELVYNEYKAKMYELVDGIVESVKEKFCLVNLGKTIAIMPKTAQIPNEVYVENQKIRVLITKVELDTKGAQVTVSRSDKTFIRRLFEKEIPEICEGTVEIKDVSRTPGERCKVSVFSKKENVDPIGACIGPRGSRIQVVLNELGNEKIDIFEWSKNTYDLIKNAFSPANILGVFEIPSREYINEEGKEVKKTNLIVVVPDHQISLAIGKSGVNAKLAAKLCNNHLDIKPETMIDEKYPDWKMMSLAYKAKVDAELRSAMVQEEQQIIDTPIVEEIVEVIEEVKEVEEVAPYVPVEEVVIVKKKKREKVNYVSKLEVLADATAASPVKKEEDKKDFKKKYKKEDEERKLRASELDTNKEYVFKPTYTQEELDAFNQDEENNKWEDSVYDEEYDDDSFYDED
ncbi:MAG: transcription termination factor NusA [Erysipelotrichaceae bacterium]